MKQLFTPLTADWFYQNVGAPTEAQLSGWRAIAAGKNVLISSPTGSGKTLAAFLYLLDRLSIQKREGALPDALCAIYVSPLKSLGNDIRKNLLKPLSGLRLENDVRVAVRTGDTPPAERQAMLRRPPHILITTPESLYLLLSSSGGRKLVQTAKTIILDEFHATASTKRGVHLMLSCERLDAICPSPLQRIALSATIQPLPLAAKILSPNSDAEIVSPRMAKVRRILVDTPVPDLRALPERSIWPCLADRILEKTENARSILAFADGRASCERLAHQMNARANAEIARTHHGCISKEQRLEAETLLKSGKLRVMAATSSMELGIDVGEIDEVAQIGNS